MKDFFSSVSFKLLFIAALFVVLVNSQKVFAKGKIDFLEPSAKEWEVFNRLTKVAGLSNMDLAIENDDNDINAAAWTKHRVSVTSGTIKKSLYFHGDYRLMIAILAHELAHTKDVDMSTDKSGPKARNDERWADYYAIKILHKGGYGCELQETLIRSMRNGERMTTKPGSSHPSDTERLNSSIKNCESLKKTGHLPDNLYLE